MKDPRHILISRTDSIGDVMLTLPVCKLLKDHFPGCKISFLGRNYTRAIIETSENVDRFIDAEDFLRTGFAFAADKPDAIVHVFPVAAIAKKAKQLGIPLRIGTTNRSYHWFSCNKLVKLSRKNSDLHEAQLNIKLLDAFGIKTDHSLEEIGGFFGFTKIKPLPEKFKALVQPGKYNIILHPKSQGSAREWGLDNFIGLIHLLDRTQFNILISGTAKERAGMNELFEQAKDEVTDITGLLSLDEFISFIDHCDGLVANSTGPLHIAAALGKDALGIYPPIRPMHPGRWAPLGKKVKVFVLDKDCNACRKDAGACVCIKQLSPAAIREVLERRD